MTTETNFPDDESSRIRREFYAEAEMRLKEFMATGEGIDWEDMCAYLQDRADGKPCTPPKAKKIIL